MTEFLYGIHPALETLAAGRRRVHRAWLADRDAGNRLRALRAAFSRHSLDVSTTTRETLRRLSGSTEHQGVVIETDAYPYAGLDGLGEPSRVLLMDNVEDPQNVGAVLRSALFFGWRAVLLSARGVPGVYPSVVKASAGASEHLSVARDRPANRYFGWLRQHGYTVAVLETGGKTAPEELALRSPAKLALVLGGEHRGVGQYIRMHADAIVGLAGCGPVTSLNASVAAGIILHRLAEKEIAKS